MVNGATDAPAHPGDIDPLVSIRADIESAFAARDLPRMVASLEFHTIEAWFAFDPDRFVQILRAALRSDLSDDSHLHAVATLIPSAGHTRLPESSRVTLRPESMTTKTRLIVRLSPMLELRYAGHPVRALRAHDDHGRQPALPLQAVFDSLGGWQLFSAAQRGLTAMLAGDFSEALRAFAEAEAQPALPTLTVLERMIYSRVALVHAAYGDPVQAARYLDAFDRTPRTASWAETSFEATARCARIIIDAGVRPGAVADLERLSIRDLGELWPFYLVALQRVHSCSSETDTFEQAVLRYSHVPFPHHVGEGLTGSIFPLMQAIIAVQKGQVEESWRALRRSDTSLPLMKTAEAVLHSRTGAPHHALSLATGAAASVQGLRRLEVLRLSALSDAFLRLQQEDDVRKSCEQALRTAGALHPTEACLFSAEVHAFAERAVPGWPQRAPTLFRSQRGEPARRPHALSTEELAIARALATGTPLLAVAESLFLPLYELRDQQRTLRIGLGLQESASDAAIVLEAERRGLL